MKIGDQVEFFWNGSWQVAKVVGIKEADNFPYLIETEINGKPTRLWTDDQSLHEIANDEIHLEFEMDDPTPVVKYERCPLCGWTGDKGAWRFYCTNPQCQNY